MRTFLQTLVGTMLITLLALGAWSLLSRAGFPFAASAASGLRVPPGCVPPEMAGIQDLLSRTSDPAARQALQARENALERDALDCAANATAHPPAKKPAHADLLPTAPAAATPTLQPGIQNAELLPTGDFLPTEDGNNMWTGTLNGHALQVIAGAANASDQGWQVQHPDWAAQPQMHVQGALRVIADGDSEHATVYPTAGRHGSLQLVTVCDTLVVVQAADGTQTGFDLNSLRYTNRPAACPASTP